MQHCPQVGGPLLGSEDKDVMASILVHCGSWVFSQPIMTDDARTPSSVFAPPHFGVMEAVRPALCLVNKEVHTLLCHNPFFIF